MKDNILKYILVVSLLMNFSLLGTAGYTHYKQSSFRSATSVGPGIPGRAGQSDCGVNGHLFQQLSLNPEQLKLFQQKAEIFHATVITKRQEVDRLRRTLLALLREDLPDDKTMQATIARINKEQEEIQKISVAHMLEFKSMLNKDQQKKFMNMIEDAMCPVTK
jgi:Spy/CpxP family protein refolding chaperone